MKTDDDFDYLKHPDMAAAKAVAQQMQTIIDARIAGWFRAQAFRRKLGGLDQDVRP